MALKTNYKDDVLNQEVNTNRKYRMIYNDDGTVSFEDVTEYTQVGDSLSAGDINEIADRANKSCQFVSVGSSTDYTKQSYLVLKENWTSIPVGVVSVGITYGSGFAIGRKMNENNGRFYVAGGWDSPMPDDSYEVMVQNGTFMFRKIDLETMGWINF